MGSSNQQTEGSNTMKNATFLENVGNASTTVLFHGRNIGHDVNAAAYVNENGSIQVVLESGATRVRGSEVKHFGSEVDYENWKDTLTPRSLPLFIAAIEDFNGAVALVGGSR